MTQPYALDINITDENVIFVSCAPEAEGSGYFYVLTPSGKLMGKVDIPGENCRLETIARRYFTETGTYTCRVAGYDNITKVEKTVVKNNDGSFTYTPMTPHYTPPGTPQTPPGQQVTIPKGEDKTKPEIYALVIVLVIVILAIIMLGGKR